MKNLKKIKCTSIFFKSRKYPYLAREPLKNLRYSKNKNYVFLRYTHHLAEDSLQTPSSGKR